MSLNFNGTEVQAVNFGEEEVETLNYNGTTVWEASKAVTWADGSWEEIGEMLAAHYRGEIDIADYWAVGDVRKDVPLAAISSFGGTSNTDTFIPESHAAQNIDLVIVGIKHDDLADGSGKAAITVGQVDCLSEKGPMHYVTGTTYYPYQARWTTSPRRKWMEYYFNALPTDLSSKIKTVKKLSFYASSADPIDYTIDSTEEKCFLPSGTEFNKYFYVFYAYSVSTGGIGSKASYFDSIDGAQYSYYSIQSNKIKKLGQDGSACYYHSRTGYYNNGDANVGTKDPGVSTNGAYTELQVYGWYGICPHFCL